MAAYLTDIGLNKLAKWAVDNAGLKPEQISEMVKEMHPVGSYYWSSDSTSPSSLFGGSWTQVTGEKYLYCNSETSSVSAPNVPINSNHMPSHNHGGSLSHTHGSPNHSHTAPAHSHPISFGTHTHTINHPTDCHYVWLRYDSFKRYISPDRNHYLYFASHYNYGIQTTNNTNSVSVDITGASTVVGISEKEPGAKTFPDAGPGNTGYSGSFTSGAATCSYSTSSQASITLDPPYINAYCWYRYA